MAEEAAAESESQKGSGSLIWIAISVLIVVLAAGAGFLVGKFKTGPARAEATPREEVQAPEPIGSAGPDSFEYVDFDPDITVNLYEQRLARYLRVKITLAVESKNAKEAERAVKAREPELLSWLNAYLSGLTLDEVGGTRNQNRLRREITEAFNDRLWPKRKGLIEQVLFREFAIQ